jgi:hypothetical protein
MIRERLASTYCHGFNGNHRAKTKLTHQLFKLKKLNNL